MSLSNLLYVVSVNSLFALDQKEAILFTCGERERGKTCLRLISQHLLFNLALNTEETQ